MRRRRFLHHTLSAAAAVACSPELLAAPAKAGSLKLGSQERRIPGANLREKVANLEKWGACGLELGGDPANRIAEVKEALKGTGVKVSALCWGACNGDLVATDAGRRKAGIEALKRALDTAGELEATGVILVPCFHKQSGLAPGELDKILLEILPAIGDHAIKAGSRVLLEPLNQGETFYLNRLEQAAAICRQVKHPGICLMGDFYHMAKEEKSDAEAFKTGAPWLHHVHLASRVRWLPGQDKLKEPDRPERSFVEGFRALQQIGYQDYCSLECGVAPGTDPMVAVPAAFDFLRAQWAEAAQGKALK
jgi:sugar phosphate isomerase/epimerase